LEYLKPEKIIVLGKAPYNFICTEFNKKPHMVDTFKNYLSKAKNNNLLYINNVPVLCIPHPSMWNTNVKNQDEWKELITDFIR
jgi:uracil-DNA glycosylase